MTTRAEIVAEARSWLGTPYHHQARLKGVGVDCAGLLIGVARNLGMVPPDMDVSNYPRQPDGVSLLAACDRWMQRVDLRDLLPGDAIAVRFETDPQHLGILGDYRASGLSIIHSADQRGHVRGKVLEHRLMPFFEGRVVTGYRFPGVLD